MPCSLFYIYLEGVTRDSVLTLAKASGKFTVSERWVPIAEIYEAALENRVQYIYMYLTSCFIHVLCSTS